MEDSEKRKERLKAMRMEAAQVDVSASFETSSMLGHLSNPLAEASTMITRQQESYAPPRFDYYTDPMSAYSGVKRNNADQQIKPDNVSSPSNHTSYTTAQFSSFLPGPTTGAHQKHSNQSTHQPQGHYTSGTHHMGPRGIINTSPLHQGYSPDAWNGFGPPPGNFAPLRGPMRSPHPFPMHQRTPEAWNRFGGRGNHSLPPRPGYHPPDSSGFNYRQGNAPSSGGNTGSGSGRGRGSGHSTTPKFGRNNGRGQAFNSCGHATSRTMGAEPFYDKSMEEDPWQNLEPVLWRSCLDTPASSSKSPASSDSWLPRSITAKKPRVSDVPNKSNSESRQSLADYLAASLDEATCDEPSA